MPAEPVQPLSGERRASVFRFGVFEANLATCELRKSGIRLRLQGQPFKILSILLARPNEIISREELQQELWGSNTAVDFEHGLGTAINKLREALGDSSSAPRYIETISRRGYRFIAPVAELPVLEEHQVSKPPMLPPAPSVAVPTDSSQAHPAVPVWTEVGTKMVPSPVAGRSGRRSQFLIFLSVGLAIGAVIGALLALGHRSTELIQVRQITWSGHIYPGSAIDETFANIVTDGVRLYFRVLDGGRFGIETAPVTGDGNALTSRVTVPADIASPILDDISRDGSELLVGDHAWSALEWPLWIMPTTGGIAHRVSDLYAHDATWMPDRRSILYARGDDLLIYGGPSKSIETFAHLPGRGFRPRWSPDSKRLRVTVVDANSRASSLWEIDVAKRKPIRLFPDSTESQCCGSWAPGGQYYLFQRSAENTSDIWMQSPPSLRTAPGQITGGPLQFSSPVPSPDRGVFFAVGVQTHARLEQFDPQTHHFLPYLPNLATASRYAFSPDGSELAWVSSNDGSLWRSKVDGTQRVQLSSSPFQVFMMSWSPDGRQIAVMGKRPGEPWKLYLVSPGGGDLRPLLKEHHNEADPTWSPDGAQLAFGRSVEYMGEEGVRKAVYVFDTRTKSLKELPGSVGMFSPRWSPNGQYLACATLDQRQLRVFNLGTQTWATVANKGIDNPVWTHDGEWLYFADFTDRNKPIYRVRLADKKVEKVADITDLGGSGNRNYNFFGLSEAGLPVVFADSWSADIFSLNRSERRFQNW